MDIIKSATLSNVQIELMPNVGWREAAKRGKISMSYKICGVMEVVGLGKVFVRARIANPDYTDLGGFVTGRSANNPPVLDDGQKFDAFELVTETDGVTPVQGPDGGPIYKEAPIITDDGQEFPQEYGTCQFCRHDPGKVLTLKDIRNLVPAKGTYTLRDGKTKIPIATVEFGGWEVVNIVVSSGGRLGGGLAVTSGTKREQAARKTAAADPAGMELPG